MGGVLPARAPPPYGPKFSHFHAVFGKIWQNRMLAPAARGLAPPPTGNPGSAPAVDVCRTPWRHIPWRQPSQRHTPR